MSCLHDSPCMVPLTFLRDLSSLRAFSCAKNASAAHCSAGIAKLVVVFLVVDSGCAKPSVVA
jgi:hypothetical protein